MTANVQTAPTHITERELEENLTAILDRATNGEHIVVERDGEMIATLGPAPRRIATWGDLVHFLTHESPFDEEFAEAVREVRASQGPARAVEWPE